MLFFLSFVGVFNTSENSAMDPHKQLSGDIAHSLLQINAIKLNVENPFIWASGLRSPVYCDNRRILSYPAIRHKVVNGLTGLVRKKYPEVELIAGVATGAIAHGVLVAEQLGLPFIYVRSAPKGHGLGSQIEGHVEKGLRTVVIEDLVSTAKSSVAAVQALARAGLDVRGMVAIFTYGLAESRKTLDAAACPFTALSDFDSLMALPGTQTQFSQKDLAALQAWREDPIAWSDARTQ